jgi:hypothetical protein
MARPGKDVLGGCTILQILSFAYYNHDDDAISLRETSSFNGEGEPGQMELMKYKEDSR